MTNLRFRLGSQVLTIVHGRDVREIRDRGEARRIVQALCAEGGDHFARQLLESLGPTSTLGHDDEKERLIQSLLDGSVVLVRQRGAPRLLDPQKAEWISNLAAGDGGGTEPPPVRRDEDETTWFEVRVLDELGQPLEGLALRLFVDGIDHRVSTNASGTARIDGATLSNATVTIDDLGALRSVVQPRWEQARGGEWITVEPEHTYLGARSPLPIVRIRSKTLHTLVVQPRVILARIKGMLFDTSKSFLLPNAIPHLPRLTALYQNGRDSKLLLVGHTDTTGDADVNDPLSLARAEAVAAFLRDDPEPWQSSRDEGLQHS